MNAYTDDEEIAEGASTGGGMIALYPAPEVAKRLSDHAGVEEPPDHVHVTLKFLGEDHTELGDLKGKVADSLRAFAASEKPLSGHTGRVGTFRPTDEGETPVYAGVDVDGLQEFRARLVKALPDGVMADTHGSYKPHITLKYADSKDHGIEDPEPLPLRFDKVHLVLGGKHQTFPLEG